MKSFGRNASRHKSLDAVATLPCLGYLALRGDCENIALATLLVSENVHTATSWSSRR